MVACSGKPNSPFFELKPNLTQDLRYSGKSGKANIGEFYWSFFTVIFDQILKIVRNLSKVNV